MTESVDVPDDTLLVRVSAHGPRRVPREGRALDPRSVRTRAAVVEAATALFLTQGYVGTSVDDIAAAAHVSKRTVYNNFGDKENLFTEIVLGVTATAEQFADKLVGALRDTTDVAAALRTLARQHVGAVSNPQIVRLRRLIIAEAARFPELAREYHRRAPGRVITALAEAFAALGERGALRVPDPRRAAEHFSFLVLGAVLDEAMFAPDAPPPSEAERDRIATDAVEVFLAAYR
ncbi:TetR/AcrR family transcriptional regulator [Amycolatopsis thermalba]|uniref:TetR/AcrR family transcriptional regulator n=1 Tax=Amycolatopsis thermalba TaxID=944492 RepID=A0ABY4NUS7_9PSEU|nr:MULTISPECIES: TetR/AcrR family transcriptional regulator [Amycolatopsis]UQS23830.1 TetR/AcrR family transcriptional regulator [Amycolatopsis thermalba]